MDKTAQQLEEELIKRIETKSFIVNGLENHEPYLRAIESFRSTRDSIDQTWHLVMDFNKLQELRMTKMAANSIINFVSDMKFDLDKLQSELVKLRNPGDMVDKDYDSE